MLLHSGGMQRTRLIPPGRVGQDHGMLRGDKISLRARYETDVPVLHSELYDDVATRSRADSRPWRPIAPGSSASPYAVSDPSDEVAFFSVVHLADDELAGEALLWGIDVHNRTAHLGLSLRPAFRGRGLGADTVRVLCRYGFAVRGLHRLQIETLADNAAMIRAAGQAGFVLEGTLRRAAWVNGEFIDEVILGLLDVKRELSS
jgi:RimJ/RimL family protein N-acetyltransferase